MTIIATIRRYLNRHDCDNYWVLSETPELRNSHVPIVCAICGQPPRKVRA